MASPRFRISMHRIRGFALFEVMAAMMVLSVSFLGTALPSCSAKPPVALRCGVAAAR
jgi:prepilin-type N-terminal cleavage/methylation domain-containing protein